jgi:iron complex outermembrane recepter protein
MITTTTSARCKSPILGGALAIALLAGPPVLGQAVTSNPPPGTAAPAAGSYALEEIIVTAQKREQSINDVAMTITAVDATTLERQQINSLADLAQVVPGMSYSTTKTGNPVYTIRGVGFYDASLAAYPAVSVYVDEIPLPFPVLSNHAQFDLERVEVLKGPQGTLFGENSTGGAVNYIQAKPTKDFDSGVDLTYGRFNATYLDGHVSGALNDEITARFATRIERADGWQNSNTRPDDTNGAVRNFMGRFLTDYTPAANAKFELSLTAWEDKSQTQAPQFIGLQPNFPPQYVYPSVKFAPESPLEDQAADWTPGVPFKDNTFYHAGLRGDIVLPGQLSLTSLSSYIIYHEDQGQDVDGLPVSNEDLPLDIAEIHTFTQELRLANDVKNSFRWLVGGNFEHSQVNEDLSVNFPQASSNLYLGEVLGYPISEDHSPTQQRMQNWALFTSDEYDLTQSVTLKAGVRYTDTDRYASLCNADAIAPYWTGRFFYDVELGGKYGPYIPNECFAINGVKPSVATLIDPPPYGAPGTFQDDLDEHNVAWTIGPQWKPDPSTLVYATASKGYKAGSFANLAASNFLQYLPVKQESVLAFEVGVKSTLADGRLQFNGAIFDYDYTDKQLLSKRIDPVFGLLDVLQNIPKSVVHGAEINIITRPIAPLTLNFAATYMQAKITDFTGINSGGVAANFAGSQMPDTPNWQLAYDMEYRFATFIESYEGYVGAGATYRSSTVAIVGGATTPTDFSSSEVSCPYCIGGYTLVNLRAGLTNAHWRYEVWGKNVFNKYYWLDNLQTTADTVSRYAGMPATYGITVGYKF